MNLLRTIWVVYADFIKNPHFRGPNFTWLVPLRVGFYSWKASRRQTWWERENEYDKKEQQYLEDRSRKP